MDNESFLKGVGMKCVCVCVWGGGGGGGRMLLLQKRIWST